MLLFIREHRRSGQRDSHRRCCHLAAVSSELREVHPEQQDIVTWPCPRSGHSLRMVSSLNGECCSSEGHLLQMCLISCRVVSQVNVIDKPRHRSEKEGTVLALKLPASGFLSELCFFRSISCWSSATRILCLPPSRRFLLGENSAAEWLQSSAWRHSPRRRKRNSRYVYQLLTFP